MLYRVSPWQSKFYMVILEHIAFIERRKRATALYDDAYKMLSVLHIVNVFLSSSLN